MFTRAAWEPSRISAGVNATRQRGLRCGEPTESVPEAPWVEGEDMTNTGVLYGVPLPATQHRARVSRTRMQLTQAARSVTYPCRARCTIQRAGGPVVLTGTKRTLRRCMASQTAAASVASCMARWATDRPSLARPTLGWRSSTAPPRFSPRTANTFLLNSIPVAIMVVSLPLRSELMKVRTSHLGTASQCSASRMTRGEDGPSTR